MLQLLITADDFTGALDTGVQFGKQGYGTRVATAQAPELPANGAAQVLVVDTQSRHVPPEEAYRRVFAWAKAARNAGVPLLYKKTDSTLRGNIGAELEAMLRASGRETLVFVPAFPKLKRTVKGGVAFVDGVTLYETAIAKDPFNPVPCSEVAEIVNAGTSLPVRTAGPGELSRVLEEDGGLRIIAIDAETDDDLALIARQAARWGEAAVFAGCAGFAEHLGGLMAPPPAVREERVRAEKMLVVCGSVNAVSLRQAAAAEAAGVCSVRLTAKQLLDEGYPSAFEGRSLIGRLGQDLKDHRCLVLKTAGNSADVDETVRIAESRNITQKKLHTVIASRTGEIVEGILEAQDADVLAVFGGDTLFGIVKRLDCRAITPQKELFPGVVQSTLQTGRGNRVVVSKAGGFGEDDLIRRLMEHYGMV